jgi:hypothetical protein
MKIEVVVLVDVPEHPKQWNFLMADALRNIASEIYLHPNEIHSEGETLHCTYEYTVQGRE